MQETPIVNLIRDEVWGSNDGKVWIPVYADTAPSFRYLKLTAESAEATYTIAVPDWLRNCPRESR